MSDQKLTEDEAATLEGIIRWHVACHVDQPDGGYLSLGIENVVNMTALIVAARVAAAGAKVARLTSERDAANAEGGRMLTLAEREAARATKAEALVKAGLGLADEADVRVTAPGFPVKGWVDTNSIRDVLGGAK